MTFQEACKILNLNEELPVEALKRTAKGINKSFTKKAPLRYKVATSVILGA